MNMPSVAKYFTVSFDHYAERQHQLQMGAYDQREAAFESECESLLANNRADPEAAEQTMNDALGYMDNDHYKALGIAWAAGDKDAMAEVINALCQKSIEREAEQNIDDRNWR